MNTPCPACSNSPSGSAGHDAMMACSVGSAGISLQCQTCQTFWERTPDQRGGFTWRALSDRAALSPCTGVAVPPRSTDTAGRPLPVRNDPEFDRFVAAVLGKAFSTNRRSPKRP